MDDEVQAPEPANMAWLLTFADLVSLLITFFVLLYSMKVVDTQKWDELKGTFSGVFSIREPIYEVRPDKDTTVEKIDMAVADNLDYVYALMTRSFNKSENLKDARIDRDSEKNILMISLPNTSVFGAKNAELLAEGTVKIRELGDILRHLDNRIEVAGHTNKEIVRTREFPSNWELSILRAINVSEILHEQGIERGITTAGYGFSRYNQMDVFLSEEKKKELADRVEIILHGTKDFL